jgi:hypothetical protein
VRQNLQPRAVRIVHHDQRDAIVGRDVAEADILQIAAKVREGERFVVEDFDEPGRTTAVLHIGPAALGYRGNVETVARFNERALVFGETVERPMALKMLPHLAAAVCRLGGLHARRRDNVEEFVSHDDLLPSRLRK